MTCGHHCREVEQYRCHHWPVGRLPLSKVAGQPTQEGIDALGICIFPPSLMADVYGISIREPGGYDKLQLANLAAPTRGSNLRKPKNDNGKAQYFSEVSSRCL